MKIKTKIHLSSTLMMFLILVLTAVGIYYTFQKMYYDSEYKQLLEETNDLVISLAQTGSINEPDTLLRAYLPKNSAFRLIDTNGKVISTVQSIDYIERVSKNVSEKHYEVIQVKNMAVLTFVVPAILNDGTIVKVQTMQSMKSAVQMLELLKIILISVTLFATIFIFLSSATLTKIVLTPIQRLTTAMHKNSSSGKYEKIDNTHFSKDELGQMGKTFNEMMTQLEQNYEKQQLFVSNASHELKTPLTVIESYARLLTRRGFKNEAIAHESIDAILSESVRMKEMIQQMLDLAKNNENAPLHIENISLYDVVQEVQQQMIHAYKRKIILRGEQHIFIKSDDNKVKQLLFIFLENAHRYSDGDIHLSIFAPAEICIEDFGEGIAAQDLPYIFDRFYRVDQDRNRKTGGTGLGLAIAKELAARLNVEIRIESEVGKGTRVFLKFEEAVHEEN